MLDHVFLRDNYSSCVDLSLVVEGEAIPLSKMGPWSVVPREQVELPEHSTGQVLMSIDGRSHSWDVVIPHGAVPFNDIEVQYIER